MYLRGLAISLNRVAKLVRRSDSGEARALNEEVIPLADRIYGDFVYDLDFRLAQVSALSWIVAAEKDRDRSRSLTLAHRELTLARLLYAGWPNNPDVQIALAVALAQVAERRVLTDSVEGIATFEEALPLYRRLVKRYPDNLLINVNLALCLAELADRGIQSAERYQESLLYLRRLDEKGLLPEAQRQWIPGIEKALNSL